jgi:DNA end-binding protein Ku
MSDLAGHIIDTKSSHFDPKKFEDHYENALVELLRTKQAGRAIEPIREEAPPPQRVINLMDALRASIGSETGKKPPAPSATVRAGARTPAGGRTAKGTATAKTTAAAKSTVAAKGTTAAKATKRKTSR